jgi:tRNA modification GTPase
MSGDTIYALSSSAGKAGVSVVRVSGARALESFKTLCQISGDIKPRHALFSKLHDPRTKDVIDNALVIPFRNPFSFTGEDVVEYHIHGSPAVLSLLLETLSSFDGHRMAEHGEFTRRAFENGKLDLTEAESIADLINAETNAQRQQALLQMDGALSNLYEGWRARLIKIMAYIEAVIDFPDEDIPDSQINTMLPSLQTLVTEMSAHLNDNRRGERLRDGIHIAVIGAPNAGKSSLVNALSHRDVAIVSPMAGTTRDVIEVHLDIAGYPVILADTAGLRPDQIVEDGAHGTIEALGIKRALERAQNADIRLVLFDGTLQELDKHALSLLNENSVVVLTKMDDKNFNKDLSKNLSVPVVHISTITNGGMEQLLNDLSFLVQRLFSSSRETPSLTRARHRDALEESLECIQNAMNAPLPELMAEDIRMAARGLGRITGRVDVEDLLDVIFRDFCIGK